MNPLLYILFFEVLMYLTNSVKKPINVMKLHNRGITFLVRLHNNSVRGFSPTPLSLHNGFKPSPNSYSYSSVFLRRPHKFDNICQLFWRFLSQSNWEISSNFVSVLENRNFIFIRLKNSQVEKSFSCHVSAYFEINRNMKIYQ